MPQRLSTLAARSRRSIPYPAQPPRQTSAPMKFARIPRGAVAGRWNALCELWGKQAAEFGGGRKVRGVGSELLVLDSHLSYP
jgi:hypothetical protein